MDIIISKFNYLMSVLLMMVGLWAMIAKNNLVKKIIGMSIFQPAIILFYVSISTKRGGTIPILTAEDIAAGSANAISAANYDNPLPHVLMLTAIVVGVATLGVALAIIQKVYAEHGTLEEDEILEQMK